MNTWNKLPSRARSSLLSILQLRSLKSTAIYFYFEIKIKLKLLFLSPFIYICTLEITFCLNVALSSNVIIEYVKNINVIGMAYMTFVSIHAFILR